MYFTSLADMTDFIAFRMNAEPDIRAKTQDREGIKSS
jgi:hypothetical protein